MSLLIDGHKQEVLFEDVHMACPILHPLVPPVPLIGVIGDPFTGVVPPCQLLIEEAAEDV